MKAAVWWIRRDMRLADNQALQAALSHADSVLPVFVLDPKLLSSRYVGEKRLAFLIAGLRQLDADLRARGNRLVIRRGAPEDELVRLASEASADAVFAEEDFSPYARRRDARIAQHLALHLENGLTVHPPGSILKADGAPYTVFTPFSRRWKSHNAPAIGSVQPAPARIPGNCRVPSLPLPEEPHVASIMPFDAGEATAQRRIREFVDGHDAAIFSYGSTRNQLDLAGTSQLSPYLRFGMLSARQAAVGAMTAIDNAPDDTARASAETWLSELIWREFFINILFHFPHVRESSFQDKFTNIAWQNDETAFNAWCQGQTGYPVVDAAMRQLTQFGWMHNRARMIVASFLVKDLLVDWRWGEAWFMQHLVDGEPAANNGGWQWSAGTGTDAAPYFRVFNPVLQSKKHDPEGNFIRRWVPELRGIPGKYVHEPWRMSSQEQAKYGCILGQDYAYPMVDHAEMRTKAIRLYQIAAQQ